MSPRWKKDAPVAHWQHTPSSMLARAHASACKGEVGAAGIPAVCWMRGPTPMVSAMVVRSPLPFLERTPDNSNNAFLLSFDDIIMFLFVNNNLDGLMVEC